MCNFNITSSKIRPSNSIKRMDDQEGILQLNKIFKEISEKRSLSMTFELYMAGDINDAKRFLVKTASIQGNCWSIEPTEYIYSGGREQGFIVRYINYPKHPKTYSELEEECKNLAIHLMTELGQGSCSIVGPEETIFLTRRPKDE